MKIVILFGVLAALAGCAGITERTGLSTEAQMCIATTVVAKMNTPEFKALPMLDRIGVVATACELDFNKMVGDTIQTAIIAADKAE